MQSKKPLPQVLADWNGLRFKNIGNVLTGIIAELYSTPQGIAKHILKDTQKKRTHKGANDYER